MKLIKQYVPKDFNLFLFGDLHIGSILYYGRGFDTLRNMMVKKYYGCKNNYGVCHGDVIEAITIDDKRYRTGMNKTESILAQMDTAVAELKPIANMLVCGLDGNHEAKLSNFGEVAETIYNRLDVPFGTYSARITYEFKCGTSFKHFATHGFRSITSTADDVKRQKANMQIQLKRLLKKKSDTCALATMGHTHKLFTCEPESQLYLDDDGLEVTQNYTELCMNGYMHHEDRWFGNTGSFYRLYADGKSGYAERFGYDPVELGFLIAVIRDKEIIRLDKVTV